jgi:hypothetical protein
MSQQAMQAQCDGVFIRKEIGLASRAVAGRGLR